MTDSIKTPEDSSGILNIAKIVSDLRGVRVSSLEDRKRRNKPPKLPSRKVLTDIVEGIAAALFPNRLGLPDLTEDGIDYFVGHTLDTALRELSAQVRLELDFSASLDQPNSQISNDSAAAEQHIEQQMLQARKIVKQFAETLPSIRVLLDSDIVAAYEGDPAARSIDEVLVCYPGITAITHYRIAHVLHKLGVPLIARIISEIAHSSTGIDIHPGAQIDERF
ncbi:MAG TPA: serine acetyltransferase, partial [Methyloradius sp.]|nr:serine acetyltransferase [Methyloradius sp.]